MLGKCLVVRYELDAQKRLSTILKQQWNDVLDISCVRINGKDLTFVRDREEWWVCELGDMNRVEVIIFNDEIVELVVYCFQPEIKKDADLGDVKAAMPQTMIEETLLLFRVGIPINMFPLEKNKESKNSMQSQSRQKLSKRWLNMLHKATVYDWCTIGDGVTGQSRQLLPTPHELVRGCQP